MATPYAATHVTVGGLLLRSRAVDCDDWSDLLKSPAKRGVNRAVRGQSGRKVRPRANDELRGLLPVRLDGSWDQDNVRESGGPVEWHANLYTLLAEVRQIADVTSPQTLSFVWPGGTTAADCIVEEMSEPAFGSLSGGPMWSARVVLDVTLPDGPLDLAGS